MGELDKILQKNFIEKNLNKTYSVIIETLSPEGYVGHTENFIKCYIKTSKQLNQNDIINVKPIKFFKDGAIAEII